MNLLYDKYLYEVNFSFNEHSFYIQSLKLKEPLKPITLCKHLNRYHQSESTHNRLCIARKRARFRRVCLESQFQHVGKILD